MQPAIVQRMFGELQLTGRGALIARGGAFGGSLVGRCANVQGTSIQSLSWLSLALAYLVTISRGKVQIPTAAAGQGLSGLMAASSLVVHGVGG